MIHLSLFAVPYATIVPKLILLPLHTGFRLVPTNKEKMSNADESSWNVSAMWTPTLPAGQNCSLLNVTFYPTLRLTYWVCLRPLADLILPNPRRHRFQFQMRIRHRYQWVIVVAVTAATLYQVTNFAVFIKPLCGDWCTGAWHRRIICFSFARWFCRDFRHNYHLRWPSTATCKHQPNKQ